MVLMSVMMTASVFAQEFNAIPRAWKWLGNDEAIFSYDGSFEDSTAFAVNARTGKVRHGVSSPSRYTAFPVYPQGAVNLTYSPDSTKLAFTRDNDLYVIDIASGKETRLTFDGSDVILNGYASWVYYEEILADRHAIGHSGGRLTAGRSDSIVLITARCRCSLYIRLLPIRLLRHHSHRARA